jgi:hypothetical protein
MVALRSFCGPEGDVDARQPPNAADWLSLQQAACELGLSVSTVRRMIRRSQVRNRIVPRPGGFAYLIYLPNSRHAQLGAHDHRDVPADSTRSGLRLVDAEFERDRVRDDAARGDEIRLLKAQVQHLSHALTRALRDRQGQPARTTVASSTAKSTSSGGPYARYRSIARKRRWWRF